MAQKDALPTAPRPPAIVRLHQDDPVAIATQTLEPGSRLTDALTASERIPAGHKVALESIVPGAPVHKNGWLIGKASHAISPGQWVHTHNLCETADISSAPASGAGSALPSGPSTFLGYRRQDGRAGTRNYLAVCIAGNCAATAARKIAEWFTPERLAPFPNIDGVIPLTHEFGCGMEMTGEPMDLLRRTLAASVRHPNVAGAVIVALGCERNNLYGFLEQEALVPGPLLRTVVLQEVGGTVSAIEQGVAALREMLPTANSAQREPLPLSLLAVGMLHHGLDGHAALTSSPALAVAADMLIAASGTLITGDSPAVTRLAGEISGRAASAETSRQLTKRLEWWKQYHAGRNTRLRTGRLPQGNPDGISTMREQAALGLQSAGNAPLASFADYGRPIGGPGWVLMDTPSYEAVAATGIIAGGATLLSLATGTGSSFGAALAPTVKIATNSTLHRKWVDDIDIDAGAVLDGAIPTAEMGKRIFEHWIACASGRPTFNEELGIGGEEFSPWPIGVLA